MAKEQPEKKEYWNSELRSLGIEPKRTSDLNNKEELEDLTDNVKQMLYQDYKTAYNAKNIDKSHFDHII